MKKKQPINEINWLNWNKKRKLFSDVMRCDAMCMYVWRCRYVYCLVVWIVRCKLFVCVLMCKCVCVFFWLLLYCSYLSCVYFQFTFKSSYSGFAFTSSVLMVSVYLIWFEFLWRSEVIRNEYWTIWINCLSWHGITICPYSAWIFVCLEKNAVFVFRH